MKLIVEWSLKGIVLQHVHFFSRLGGVNFARSVDRFGGARGSALTALSFLAKKNTPKTRRRNQRLTFPHVGVSENVVYP